LLAVQQLVRIFVHHHDFRTFHVCGRRHG